MSLVNPAPARITPAQLRLELVRRGCNATLRAIRDWRRKGLLPKLTQRGAGRGAGARFYWADGEVVERAVIVCNVLAATNSADVALLTLWFSGFDVSAARVKATWSRQLRRQKTGARTRDSLESQSDHFWVEAEKFEAKLAVDHHLSVDDARVLVHQGLLVILGESDIHLSPDELADLRNAIVNFVMQSIRTKNITIPPDWLSEGRTKKLFALIRAAFSIEQRCRQIAAARIADLLKAQTFLKCVGRGILAVAFSGVDTDAAANLEAELPNLGPQLAATFGPFLVLFFLKLIAAGKGGMLTRSARIIDTFDRTGHRDEIQKLTNIWKGLDIFRLYNVA